MAASATAGTRHLDRFGAAAPADNRAPAGHAERFFEEMVFDRARLPRARAERRLRDRPDRPYRGGGTPGAAL